MFPNLLCAQNVAQAGNLPVIGTPGRQLGRGLRRGRHRCWKTPTGAVRPTRPWQKAWKIQGKNPKNPQKESGIKLKIEIQGCSGERRQRPRAAPLPPVPTAPFLGGLPLILSPFLALSPATNLDFPGKDPKSPRIHLSQSLWGIGRPQRPRRPRGSADEEPPTVKSHQIPAFPCPPRGGFGFSGSSSPWGR